MSQNHYAVSVIIPVYKVRGYIERCAESLMSQTLQEVEFIFVDDATPDDSIEILKSVLNRHPERQKDVTILSHSENRGLPSARNTGLAKASGEYIFHCDSDDYVELSMLEEMYDFAVKNELDIVWCDWWLTFGRKERKMFTPDYKTPQEALRGMLGGSMKYNVWNKLAKRSIYEQFSIRFPDGYGMGEDLTMLLLFAHAKKSRRLAKAFYHYVKDNCNAFSSIIRVEHFEPLKRNVLWIAKELCHLFGHEIEKEIVYLKLQSKYPLLTDSGKVEYYRLWNDWFPEANKHILGNQHISLRSKILQLSAKYKLYVIVAFHYWLLNKVYYNIIYKWKW